MTWVKLDDHFDEHEKITALSDEAFRAHVEGLCYCGRNLTDGRITLARLSRITRPRIVEELVNAGLWHRNGDGVIVNDYLEFQPSRSEVEATREARAAAGRIGGLRSGEARRKQAASKEVEA